MSAWQPISTAPTDGTCVIVSTIEGCVGEAKCYDGDKWYWAGFDPTDYVDGSVYPSHWMPLPEPPEAAS